MRKGLLLATLGLTGCVIQPVMMDIEPDCEVEVVETPVSRQETYQCSGEPVVVHHHEQIRSASNDLGVLATRGPLA